MIERNKDHTVKYTCDDCGETLETDTPQFESARAIMHNASWRSWFSKGEWHHICDDCDAEENDFH